MARPARKPVPEAEEPPQRGPSAALLRNFLRLLAHSGSVTFAAFKAGIERRTLYRRRANNEEFAAEWDEALQLGIDRLQDNAMQRALHGTERPLYRNGKQVGTTQQYDNKLLQFLLRAHRPEVYGARQQSAAPPLPFDLAQRLAASAPRADAYDEAKRAANAPTEKRNAKSKKQGG